VRKLGGKTVNLRRIKEVDELTWQAENKHVTGTSYGTVDRIDHPHVIESGAWPIEKVRRQQKWCVANREAVHQTTAPPTQRRKQS
jgi:hypothetical protein